MTSARPIHPREAVAHRAATDDGHAHYWTAILYGADLALHQGRGPEVLDALTKVVTTDGARP
jgi:hypothetical protein